MHGIKHRAAAVSLFFHFTSIEPQCVPLIKKGQTQYERSARKENLQHWDHGASQKYKVCIISGKLLSFNVWDTHFGSCEHYSGCLLTLRCFCFIYQQKRWDKLCVMSLVLFWLCLSCILTADHFIPYLWRRFNGSLKQPDPKHSIHIVHHLQKAWRRHQPLSIKNVLPLHVNCSARHCQDENIV